MGIGSTHGLVEGYGLGIELPLNQSDLGIGIVGLFGACGPLSHKVDKTFLLLLGLGQLLT